MALSSYSEPAYPTVIQPDYGQISEIAIYVNHQVQVQLLLAIADANHHILACMLDIVSS